MPNREFTVILIEIVGQKRPQFYNRAVIIAL